MSVIATVETDEGHFDINLLHEFGDLQPELTTRATFAKKVRQLYEQTRKFDVLFSDYTRGDPDSFMATFLDPRGVWMEVILNEGSPPVGCMYLTNIIPRMDVQGHFTFWDSIGSGREPVIWKGMEWVFERYDLERISVEIPPYQRGVIRFIKRLGFQEEGIRRHGIYSKDKWVDLMLFGILRAEFEEKYYE